MKLAILGLDLAIMALLVAMPFESPIKFFSLLASYIVLTGILAGVFVRPTVRKEPYADRDLLGPRV